MISNTGLGDRGYQIRSRSFTRGIRSRRALHHQHWPRQANQFQLTREEVKLSQITTHTIQVQQSSEDDCIVHQFRIVVAFRTRFHSANIQSVIQRQAS